MLLITTVRHSYRLLTWIGFCSCTHRLSTHTLDAICCVIRHILLPGGPLYIRKVENTAVYVD
jgi:hypothetical protein